MPFITGRPLSKKGGRPNNQDAADFVVKNGIGCWVLADGLGGHAAGEVASRVAVDAAIGAFEKSLSNSEDALRDLVKVAQKAVQERQRQNPNLASMKTTINILVASDGVARWIHVGDSRLYAFRAGKVIAQTNDHSVPQLLVDEGKIRREEIRDHPDRNRLIEALGKSGESHPEVGEPLNTSVGDAFLLCSDGFWEYVLEPEMEMDLQAAKNADDWIEQMERRLLARVEPGNDNYSALAVFVT